jgi:hypothetical protein
MPPLKLKGKVMVSDIDTGISKRTTAVLLATCAVLLLLAMLHHPVAHGGTDRVAAVMTVGRLSGIVHGVMIALTLVVLHALQRATGQLRAFGIDPRAGFLALAVSIACFVVAASLNGFIIPDVAREAGVMGEAQRAAFPLVVQAIVHTSQHFAVLASIAMGSALLLWSAPMLARVGGRGLGTVGVLTGGAILAMLTGGPLGVTRMTLVVAAFGVWLVSLSIWLWRQPDVQTAR